MSPSVFFWGVCLLSSTNSTFVRLCCLRVSVSAEREREREREREKERERERALGALMYTTCRPIRFLSPCIRALFFHIFCARNLRKLETGRNNNRVRLRSAFVSHLESRRVCCFLRAGRGAAHRHQGAGRAGPEMSRLCQGAPLQGMGAMCMCTYGVRSTFTCGHRRLTPLRKHRRVRPHGKPSS